MKDKTNGGVKSPLFNTHEIPFNYSGYCACKVEFDFTDYRKPLQRHIFIKPDGKQDIENWIPSWMTIEDVKNYETTTRR